MSTDENNLNEPGVTLETEPQIDSGATADAEPLLEPAVTEEEILALAESIPQEVEQSSPEEAPEERLPLSQELRAHISAAMETLLFMSDKPVSLPKLRSLIDPELALSTYREIMTELRSEFSREHRGIEIAEVSLGFQLRTKPQMATILRKLVKTTPLKLTSTMMEALAVIAYKQPVTKDEIDQVRGVDCGYLLRNLMEKRLIRIAGRSELPGKPILYGTTHEFLELFSLKDTKSLPPLHEIESMVAASEVGVEEREQKDMQEFGKMVDSSLSTKLFDDSMIDDELENIRKSIESIPVSTRFIDEQKAKEKLLGKLAELSTKGLTLDLEGNEIPLEAAPEDNKDRLLEQLSQKFHSKQEENIARDHAPSPELIAAASQAQQERLAETVSALAIDLPEENEPAAEIKELETNLNSQIPQ